MLISAGCPAPPSSCPPSATGQYPVNTQVTCTCPFVPGCPPPASAVLTCTLSGTTPTWNPPTGPVCQTACKYTLKKPHTVLWVLNLLTMK